MTIVGNLLLAVGSLLFFLFFTALTAPNQSRGGDYAAGFGWGVILFFLAFLGILLVVSLIIASRGGFDWLSANTAARYLLLLFGLVSTVVAAALATLFREEPGSAAGLVRIFSGFAPWLIPVLLLISGAILLNNSLRQSFSPLTYQIPIKVSFWLGLVINLVAAYAWMKLANENRQAVMQDEIAFQDKNHQRMLGEIDSCEIQKNMVFILVFTDSNQDPEVRNRAVAKVKTHPHWQEEIIRILGTGYAPEAFNFLASNDVDNKSLFPDAIKAGIAQQAQLFRESIRRSSHPSHFYPELFLWETERVLRTVERFKESNSQYLKEVESLREALKEPADVEKIPLKAEKLLDEWLKKQQ